MQSIKVKLNNCDIIDFWSEDWKSIPLIELSIPYLMSKHWKPHDLAFKYYREVDKFDRLYRVLKPAIV